MTMENPTEMELVNASLPSSRSSTPSLTNCERLQLVNQDLKKFSIMLSNVSHTIECIAPITSDDDPDLAALYSRQAYFDDRHQQALEKYAPDLILIQETHLRPKYNINIPNYICYRNDRDTGERARGGTLILIRRNFPTIIYPLPTPAHRGYDRSSHPT
ncbi:hypothetical protein TNCV_3065271 [Trichonephila clavipes]|nr:hypothetical protein TNCV_3065271 [Trichonephila clavipes]